MPVESKPFHLIVEWNPDAESETTTQESVRGVFIGDVVRPYLDAVVQHREAAVFFDSPNGNTYDVTLQVARLAIVTLHARVAQNG